MLREGTSGGGLPGRMAGAMDARDWKWIRLLVGMLVFASLMGWGLWKRGRPARDASPPDWARAPPGDARRAPEDAWGEEWAAGSQEPFPDEGPGDLPWREDPGDLGWDEDLGKEGYIVWRPRLALVGPWTDSARPLP